MLSLISLGPGDLGQITSAAQRALQAAQVILGYQVYIDLVRPLLSPEQQVRPSPIGHEVERAELAVDLATSGQSVAMLSSGDIGIYAMASPVFEVLRRRGWTGDDPPVEVFPGVSAIQAAAARLGAPLGHDFCTISLSDLLTPWSVIERRLQAAAWGDFVIGFYNPRSQKRDWQLRRALGILLAHRAAETPVAVVRNVTRPDEQISLTTLAELQPEQVDMFTLVLVGNSQSYRLGERLVTPRGYMEDCRSGGLGDCNVEDLSSETVQPFDFAQGQPSTPPPLQTHLYPISLIHTDQTQAVVVGGGPVGERKVRGLLNAGVKVRLISPEVTPKLEAWAAEGQLEWLQRPYQTGDLLGSRLVFVATNHRAINAQIAQEAAQLGLLCNVADAPSEGNFHVPAVHRQPNLVISVSTLGQDPGRAKAVRDQITAQLDNNGT
ncbi:MAG TPA: precorrin-3B C(17)-methyltransferase [Anaerolineae bacterium]|nr:precorrin-3B C(17)-methyltransferase [Anaerolineae bacterium]HMR66982.1 precorrin-3B C(17)-methyltransferase [Anaerolineae bacterium]